MCKRNSPKSARPLRLLFNPLIAEPLFLTRIVERARSGILDMIALCTKVGLKPPEFRQDTGSFIQTVWRPVPVGPKARQVSGETLAKPGPSRDQAGTKSGLSRDQVKILEQVSSEKEIAVLMSQVGRKNRTKFRDLLLNPLLKIGLIEMTIPDKPRSSKQKYLLTKKGRVLLAGKKKIAT